MKPSRLAYLAAALACLGMLVPTAALAEPPTTTRTVDVALRSGGLLVGQVVDGQGKPTPNAVVAIRYSQQEIVRTTADASGVFAAKGLRGGQYQLITADGQSICRLWAADTAPPSAQQMALIVSGQDVVRGQFGYNPVRDWVEWMKCHPYLTAGTVAAAIAIPLAFADDLSSGS